MNSKKLGLALGSGAWMGLAHIGVLKSLEENKIPISFIAGSSVGAIIGGLYAFNPNIKEIEKIVNNLNLKDVNLNRLLKKIVGNVQIEDLKIPYSAISSDLLTGESVVINKGSLIAAMKASSSVPLLFSPVKINNQNLVDGGMVNPIPINTVRQMGADVVMGVNLYDGIFPIALKDKKISRLKSFKMSRYIWLKKLADIDQKSADIALNLKIKNTDFGVFAKFFNNQETVDIGYKSTNKIIEQIKNKLKH